MSTMNQVCQKGFHTRSRMSLIYQAWKIHLRLCEKRMFLDARIQVVVKLGRAARFIYSTENK